MWNALVQDDTGSITVTLWGMAAQHEQFGVGDVVELSGALKAKKINGEFLSGGTSNLELHIDSKAPKTFIRPWIGTPAPALGSLHGAITPLAAAIEQTKRGGARVSSSKTWNFLVIVARIDEIVTIRRKKKGTGGADSSSSNVVTRDCHVFDRSMVSNNDVNSTLLRLWDCIVDAPRLWTAKQTVLLLECVTLHEFNGTHSIKISKASTMIANPEIGAAAQLYGWFANRHLALPAPAPAVAASAAGAAATALVAVAPNDITEQYTIDSLRKAAPHAQQHYGFMVVALARVYVYANSLKFTCTLCSTAQSAAVVRDQSCTHCNQSFALDAPAVTLAIKVDLIDATGSLNGVWLNDAAAAAALGVKQLAALVSLRADQRTALYAAAELDRIKLFFAVQGTRLNIIACTAF